MDSFDDKRRHPRQAGEKSRTAILNFLRAQIADDAHYSTLDEIAKACNLARGTVDHHLKWLAEHHVIAIGEPRREIRLLLDESGAVEQAKVPRRGRPRRALPNIRDAITDAVQMLRGVGGHFHPVTLVALTAFILTGEQALIAREVAAMVAEGLLIQVDGGYVLPASKTQA